MTIEEEKVTHSLEAAANAGSLRAGWRRKLAPVRAGTGTSRPHNGTIITELPNQMWATDGKQFYTEDEGKCWLFSVIDHCNDEILAWHTVKIEDYNREWIIERLGYRSPLEYKDYLTSTGKMAA